MSPDATNEPRPTDEEQKEAKNPPMSDLAPRDVTEASAEQVRGGSLQIDANSGSSTMKI